MFKKERIQVALFTGIFVGIVVFISTYLIPDSNFQIVMSAIIAGISALVGGLIGNKIFKKE